jgi:hypothetical protein
MFQYNGPVLMVVNSHKKNLDQPQMNPMLYVEYYIEDIHEIAFLSNLGYEILFHDYIVFSVLSH